MNIGSAVRPPLRRGLAPCALRFAPCALLVPQALPLKPMPFGNSTGFLSRRDTTTITQRFNAGTGRSCVAPVPKGRLNPSSKGRVPFRPALGRPFGTWSVLSATPSVETLGYSRMSLRGKDRRSGRGNFRKALPLKWPCERKIPEKNKKQSVPRRQTKGVPPAN